MKKVYIPSIHVQFVLCSYRIKKRIGSQ